jgi:transcriptional regulator with XRE-family HTH domain
MMRHSATLIRVTIMTRRQLAGSVIRDERERAHMKQDDAMENFGISRVTLARAEAGSESISGGSLRAIEGGLGLPTRFLTYVIDGDVDKIKRLPSRNADSISGIREDLRQYVIEVLGEINHPPRLHRRGNSA